MTEAALRDVLAQIERREAALLTWGAVDAGFTRAELESIALGAFDEHEELAALGREAVVDALLDRNLLVRYRAGGVSLFRSRMAETVRLMARLRQWFRDDDWQRAPRLVADYRFVVRPRLRPIRELLPDDVVARLAGEVDVGEFRARVVRAYLGADGEQPTKLARFQYDATQRILGALDLGGSSGTVVTAGTGSGKTHAFYLPAMVHVAEDVLRHPAPALRALAVYPRQELLKDQLRSALVAARRVRDAGDARPIRIGAWFGDVPVNEQKIRDYDAWRPAGGGFVCPYLTCPDCGGDLVWRASQPPEVALTCRDHEHVVSADEFAVTRKEMQDAPADILFTTTESLNRQLGNTWSRAAIGTEGARRPRLCLLDEIHTYEGTHGAQVANLVRRWRHAVGAPLTFVGLSATLANAEQFFADLVGLPEPAVARVEPAAEQLERTSDEYLLALRHDPTSDTQPLSLTIQTSMLMSRMLDAPGNPTSGGAYGSKTFVFTDRLDSVNALYWQLLDAEGWWAPGRPQKRYQPHALATLRRPDTGPYDVDRDLAGQTWTMAQQLGHDLAGDRQLTMGRTTSQDAGVSADAQLVVATSALEVGFDDDAVGAVVQHKAPYEAARFLQRQGRAGRRPEMRPWTVVVLGDTGLDRLAFQGYDRLFSPTLDARRLPFRNAYVLKMQAVYAVFDWLATRLGDGREKWDVWAELRGPSGKRKNQRAAAALLTEVVDGKFARVDLERHLRTALDLSDDELTVAGWSAPRSLYLEALPTLIRRLESDWAVAGGGSDFTASTPAPEFIPSTLYSDLLVPELAVTVPAFRGKGDGKTQQLGLEQGLREFAPGNATRRYAVADRQQYHWVPVPDPGEPAGPVDLEALYTCRAEGAVDDGGTALHCLRPVAVTLRDAEGVSQYDRGELHWRVAITALPDSGTALPVPRASRFARPVAAATSYLHRDGAPVTVRRFAPAVTATTYGKGGERTIRTLPFADGAGHPAALSFTHEVDAIALTLSATHEDVATLLDDPTQLADFRWAYLVARFDDPAGFGPDVGVYDRHQLRIALLCALAGELRAGEGYHEAFQRLSPSLAAALSSAVDVIFRAPQDEPGEQADQGRALTRLRGYLSDGAVVAAIAERARVLWEDPGAEAISWLRRRVAATLAGLVVQAATVLAPELDTSDVAIDVVEDEPSLVAWVTETAPGSTGFIERLSALWHEDARTFLRVAEAGTSPGDLQVADAQLVRVLEAAAEPGGAVAAALAGLRAAWPNGHEASAAATDALRDTLEAAGLRPRRSALVGVTSRIGAPGTSAVTDEMYLRFVREWEALAATTGVAADSRVVAFVASEDDSWGAYVDRTDLTRADRYLFLSALLWPRGPELAASAVELPNRFTRLPAPAPTAVEALLGPDDAVHVALADPAWRAAADAALRATGRAVVEAPAAKLPALRDAVLDFVETPTDCGILLAYPHVESISVDATTARLHVYVAEYR